MTLTVDDHNQNHQKNYSRLLGNSLLAGAIKRLPRKTIQKTKIKFNGIDEE